ncbi:MAG: uncharacterized protein A8A55_1340 [Amphiamblys sp. WSBS2006]|nr:MAG: uncharacterized protein A8A55_1340 [Amphiamblys sp. WSBS2006]
MEGEFWGIEINPGKKYHQTVKQTFRITMAAAVNKPKRTTQVCISVDGRDFVLCSLQRRTPQQLLNHVLLSGQSISLKVIGKNSVCLTGNFIESVSAEDVQEKQGDEEMAEASLLTAEEQAGKADESEKEVEAQQSSLSTPDPQKVIKIGTKALLRYKIKYKEDGEEKETWWTKKEVVIGSNELNREVEKRLIGAPEKKKRRIKCVENGVEKIFAVTVLSLGDVEAGGSVVPREEIK